MPGDQYNAYRYDPIDDYEKERRGEHRGGVLNEDRQFIDDEGLMNQSILITRIELANGLEWKDTISYQQEEYTQDVDEEIFDVDEFFDDYGEYDSDTHRIKALRVWSGNDHWLLPKESAERYLWILPLETEVDENTMFNLVYWPPGYGNLKDELEQGTFDTKASALLYHDGNTLSGGTGDDESDVESVDQREDPPVVKKELTLVDDEDEKAVDDHNVVTEREVEVLEDDLEKRTRKESSNEISFLKFPESVSQMIRKNRIIVPAFYRNKNTMLSRCIFLYDKGDLEDYDEDEDYVVPTIDDDDDIDAYLRVRLYDYENSKFIQGDISSISLSIIPMSIWDVYNSFDGNSFLSYLIDLDEDEIEEALNEVAETFEEIYREAGVEISIETDYLQELLADGDFCDILYQEMESPSLESSYRALYWALIAQTDSKVYQLLPILDYYDLKEEKGFGQDISKFGTILYTDNLSSVGFTPNEDLLSHYASLMNKETTKNSPKKSIPRLHLYHHHTPLPIPEPTHPPLPLAPPNMEKMPVMLPDLMPYDVRFGPSVLTGSNAEYTKVGIVKIPGMYLRTEEIEENNESGDAISSFSKIKKYRVFCNRTLLPSNLGTIPESLVNDKEEVEVGTIVVTQNIPSPRDMVQLTGASDISEAESYVGLVPEDYVYVYPGDPDSRQESHPDPIYGADRQKVLPGRTKYSNTQIPSNIKDLYGKAKGFLKGLLPSIDTLFEVKVPDFIGSVYPPAEQLAREFIPKIYQFIKGKISDSGIRIPNRFLEILDYDQNSKENYQDIRIRALGHEATVRIFLSNEKTLKMLSAANDIVGYRVVTYPNNMNPGFADPTEQDIKGLELAERYLERDSNGKAVLHKKNGFVVKERPLATDGLKLKGLFAAATNWIFNKSNDITGISLKGMNAQLPLRVRVYPENQDTISEEEYIPEVILYEHTTLPDVENPEEQRTEDIEENVLDTVSTEIKDQIQEYIDGKENLPTILFDKPYEELVTANRSVGKTLIENVEDYFVSISFIGEEPKGSMRTEETIQEFLENAPIILTVKNQKDPELLETVQLRNEDVDIGENAGYNLIAKGHHVIQYRHVSFDLVFEESNNPNYQLVLIEAPTKMDYYFGETKPDLQGMVAGLKDKSTGEYVSGYEALGADNFIIQDLPIVSNSIGEDVTLIAYFMGYELKIQPKINPLQSISGRVVHGLEDVEVGYNEDLIVTFTENIQNIGVEIYQMYWPTYPSLETLKEKLIFFVVDKNLDKKELSWDLVPAKFTYDPELNADKNCCIIEAWDYITYVPLTKNVSYNVITSEFMYIVANGFLPKDATYFQIQKKRSKDKNYAAAVAAVVPAVLSFVTTMINKFAGEPHPKLLLKQGKITQEEYFHLIPNKKDKKKVPSISRKKKTPRRERYVDDYYDDEEEYYNYPPRRPTREPDPTPPAPQPTPQPEPQPKEEKKSGAASIISTIFQGAASILPAIPGIISSFSGMFGSTNDEYNTDWELEDLKTYMDLPVNTPGEKDVVLMSPINPVMEEYYEEPLVTCYSEKIEVEVPKIQKRGVVIEGDEEIVNYRFVMDQLIINNTIWPEEEDIIERIVILAQRKDGYYTHINSEEHTIRIVDYHPLSKNEEQVCSVSVDGKEVSPVILFLKGSSHLASIEKDTYYARFFYHPVVEDALLMYLFEDRSRNQSLSCATFEELEAEIGGLSKDDCYIYTLQGKEVLNVQPYRLVYSTIRTREVRKNDGSVYYHTIFRVKGEDDYVEELLYTIPCEVPRSTIISTTSKIDHEGITYILDTSAKTATISGFSSNYYAEGSQNELVIPTYIQDTNGELYTVSNATILDFSSVPYTKIVFPMYYPSSENTQLTITNLNKVREIVFSNHFIQSNLFPLITHKDNTYLEEISFASTEIVLSGIPDGKTTINSLTIAEYQNLTIKNNTVMNYYVIKEWFVEGTVTCPNKISTINADVPLLIHVYSAEKYKMMNDIFSDSIRNKVEILIPFVELTYNGDPLIYKNNAFTYPNANLKIGGFVKKDGSYTTIDLDWHEVSCMIPSMDEDHVVHVRYGDHLVIIPYVNQSTEYMEVKLYDARREYYVTKGGLLIQGDASMNGVKIIGAIPGTNLSTIEVKPFVKVVEEFTEE